MKKLIILLVIGIIGVPCFINAQTPNEDVDIDVMLLYKTVDQQVAIFIFFADSALDMYIYYQTEDEYKEGEDFEKKEWARTANVDTMPMGNFYDELKIKNINKRSFYGTGHNIDVNPNSKYYYKIVVKNGPTIKEGSFTSSAPLDQSSYPDLSLLDGYLEIDYLEGDGFQQTREKGFYACLKAQYQDKITYTLNKEIINIIFHNSATNISLIAKHGSNGFWSEMYTPTGPYLTRDEFDCFFVNGENPITVTIETEGSVQDVNENNNQFTKVLNLSGVRDIPDEFCDIDGKIFSAKIRIENKKIDFICNRLKGKILLQVEEHGEAWYVEPNTSKRFYLKDGNTAYAALRTFGLGITNDDLAEIPIGIEERAEVADSDGDGLDDKLEESLGTDINNPDSDGDGYLDGAEVKQGYNPLGTGKMPINNNLVDQVKGKILLQVESRGEAWYLNPADGKRYYMKDGDAAYQIMRFLSLGITNNDLRKIEVGDL